MKTVLKIRKKWGMAVCSCLVVLLSFSCSSVRENGEPNTTNNGPVEITNDAQRKAIYNNGGNTAPQNANPIQSSERLGMDEKSSEINRKHNIENWNDTNKPANTPNTARPKKLDRLDAPPDTLRR